MFRIIKKATVESQAVKQGIKNSFTKDISKTFQTGFLHHRIPQYLFSPNSVFDQSWVLILNFKKCFSFQAEHHYYDPS